MWVAEMDVPLAEPVARALHDAIGRGDTGYPAGTEYASALSEFAVQRWAWTGLDVGRTAVVPDVMMGIVETLHLLTEPGDAVVVCSPVYPPFYAFLTHAHRRVIEAPLGTDLRLDMAALDEAMRLAASSSSRAALLLSNPHNPTGVVHTRAELEAVAVLARAHRIRVISDEIHAPLVLPGAQFVPYLSVAGADDAFALMSASKGWNLAGLKAAVLIAGPEAATDLARLPEEVSHGPSHLGIIAHTAAFRDGGVWLDALLSGLDANRALLDDLIAERLPILQLHRPESTYLAWIDCQALGVHEAHSLDQPGVVSEMSGPARLFLDRARVALSSGHVFGTGGNGFIRLNFATSPDNIDEATRRMAETVNAMDNDSRSQEGDHR